MIKQDFAYHRQLHMFLTPWEIDALKELATTEDAWEEGRQGSGYFKLNLTELADTANEADDEGWIVELVQRALRGIIEYANIMTPDVVTGHDVYLMYYPTGSSVPCHYDPVEPDHTHVRLNAIVTEPDIGGILSIYGLSGEVLECEPVGPCVGQAVVFKPSRNAHDVSKVIAGTRLVFSVGAKIRVD